MEYFFTILMILAILAAPVVIVLLLINAIKKKSKKAPLRGLAAVVGVFIISVIGAAVTLDPNEDYGTAPPSQSVSETQEETYIAVNAEDVVQEPESSSKSKIAISSSVPVENSKNEEPKKSSSSELALTSSLPNSNEVASLQEVDEPISQASTNPSQKQSDSSSQVASGSEKPPSGTQQVQSSVSKEGQSQAIPSSGSASSAAPSSSSAPVTSSIGAKAFDAELNDSTDTVTSEGNNQTVYWTPGGKSYHNSQNCTTLKRSKTIDQGALHDALAKGKSDPCNVCVR